MKTITRKFVKAKETKNKVQFKEVNDDGVSSIIETLYVTKELAGKAEHLTVTVEVNG